MTGNIITATAGVKTEIDLKSLADTARHHHQQCVNCAINILGHAMAAGDALLAIKASGKVRHGEWDSWTGCNCDLNRRTARVYMQLAAHRSELESNRQHAAVLSLRGALKRIAVKKDAAPKKVKSAKPPVALSTLAWSDATLEQRRRFLDGIDLDSVFAAAPSTWTLEHFLKAIPKDWKTTIFEDRVEKLGKIKSRALNEKLSAAVRQVLSLQKGHHDKNVLAPTVAAALNTVNNLIIKEGADLNEIEITLNKKRTQAKKAA